MPIMNCVVVGRYPSGQRGQTVNLLPTASKVRILACPPNSAWAFAAFEVFECAKWCMQGGRSSGVELQPSKLAVASSNLVARSKLGLRDQGIRCWGNRLLSRKRSGLRQGVTRSNRDETAMSQARSSTASGAHVAQLAEHVLGKDEVTRSIRVVGSKPSLLDPELRSKATGYAIPHVILRTSRRNHFLA